MIARILSFTATKCDVVAFRCYPLDAVIAPLVLVSCYKHAAKSCLIGQARVWHRPIVVIHAAHNDDYVNRVAWHRRAFAFPECDICVRGPIDGDLVGRGTCVVRRTYICWRNVHARMDALRYLCNEPSKRQTVVQPAYELSGSFRLFVQLASAVATQMWSPRLALFHTEALHHLGVLIGHSEAADDKATYLC